MMIVAASGPSIKSEEIVLVLIGRNSGGKKVLIDISLAGTKS